MIKLTLFPQAFDEPTASPFCMKSYCMLLASGLSFDLVEINDPRKAPKGKLPFIEADGIEIADSDEIRAFIETVADFDFDHGLTDFERGAARAVIRMVEEHLYFAIVADRWGEDDNWQHIKATFFHDLPGPVRGVISSLARRQAMRNLRGQGIGLHTASERFERVRRDLIALRQMLGDQSYLFGDKACSADFSTVPMLRAAIVTPVEKPLGRFIKEDPGLMAYVARFMDAYYPTSAHVSAP
ncbi:MAG: glutathione S-transferase family protein [Pseudomonadota bacterium]